MFSLIKIPPTGRDGEKDQAEDDDGAGLPGSSDF